MDLSIPALLLTLIIPSAPGTSTVKETYEFPSMEMCYKSIENSAIMVSTDGGSKDIGLLICVPNKKK